MGFECDDFSSGYSSGNDSDHVSVTSYDSLTTSVTSSSVDRVSPPQTSLYLESQFQSAHALCEDMQIILAMPEMCDVTFLVGAREVPVHGLKAVMASRSRIMFELIQKHIHLRISEQSKVTKTKKIKGKSPVGLSQLSSEKLKIPITNYDAEVFRLLVEFIHCGEVNINEDTVAGLFCGATQFEVPELPGACLDFVERCVKLRRTENIRFHAECFKFNAAAKTLLDKV
ncbi:serine-enriched protein-like [Dreissena polymorpha]|nr:serine-enriched protein-like [Dreissena polymorpha]